MNDRELTQIDLLITYEASLFQRGLEEKLQAIYADHSAKGRLHSGLTIRVAVRAIGELAGGVLDRLASLVGGVSREKEAFEKLSLAMTEILDRLAEHMPEITRMASGRNASPRDESIRNAANKLFAEMRMDIETKLAIVAFDFLETPLEGANSALRDDQPLSAGGVTSAEAGGNESNANSVATEIVRQAIFKSGRPRADWWDDLWIEIFRQIYVGDLMPKTQADIVNAMQIWLEFRDLSASDSTLKPRARKLLNMLQSAN